MPALALHSYPCSRRMATFLCKKKSSSGDRPHCGVDERISQRKELATAYPAFPVLSQSYSCQVTYFHILISPLSSIPPNPGVAQTSSSWVWVKPRENVRRIWPCHIPTAGGPDVGLLGLKEGRWFEMEKILKFKYKSRKDSQLLERDLYSCDKGTGKLSGMPKTGKTGHLRF